MRRQTQIHDGVRQLVVARFLFGDREAIPTDDSSLEEAGVLDSLGVTELRLALEEKYRIVLEADDLSPANFSSIDSIASMVRVKLEILRSASCS